MENRLVIVGLMVSALLVAGCSDDAMQGSTLRVAVVGNQGLAQHLEAEATQPTLIARDGAGQIVPALATSWRFVDDGRSLILRLRPVKWSDGSELVSKQVVDALRRAATRREPALVHAGVENAAAIAARRVPASRLGARAPIARVVELRLASASPLLLDWLVDPGLAIDQARRGTTKSPAAAATGAPTLAAYDASGPPGKRLLTRRSAITAPDRQPAQISIASGIDSSTAIAAFNRGETDIVFGGGLAGLGNARAGARRDVLRLDPTWGVYGYIANARKGPLADAGVRRALAMAIDRAALAQQFGIAGIVPVEGLLPPSLTASVPAEPLQPDEAAEARRAEAVGLLAAAGWTQDKPLRLTLLLPPERDHRSVAERVAADWAMIGVTLVVSEVSDMRRQKTRGDFDLAVDETAFAVPDAAAMLARFRCKAGPHCNPEADLLLDKAAEALPAARAALIAEAEAAMIEAGPPMIALFTPVRWALVARGVEGWTPNRAASHPLARLNVSGR